MDSMDIAEQWGPVPETLCRHCGRRGVPGWQKIGHLFFGLCLTCWDLPEAQIHKAAALALEVQADAPLH